MKVVIVSTDDIYGGAAVAAYRLHNSLLEAGVSSTMLVKKKHSDDSLVVSVVESEFNSSQPDVFLGAKLEEYCIANNRSKPLNHLAPTHFSLDLDDYDLSANEIISEADIINIHWCSNFLSAKSIYKLLMLGKPVVWTMHDQGPFTGGCHYTDGCDRYTQDCQLCPQLLNDSLGLPALFLEEKKRCFGLERNNLSAIFPSRWLMDCAASSLLFKNKDLKVIPNSIDIKAFQPMPQGEARRLLDLPEDIFIILFVASDMNESRKGFDILNETMREASAGPHRELFEQNKILLLLVGHPVANCVQTPPVNHRYVDFVNNNDGLRRVYSSADVMAFCSREDNLPNTIIEAMGCGVPTVAYDVGGCGDIIDHGVNGYLIPQGDSRGFVDTIAEIIKSKELRAVLQDACVGAVVRKYSPEVQSRYYAEYFRYLIDHNSTPRQYDPVVESRDLHREILRRVMAQRPVNCGENRVRAVEEWLAAATEEESIYYMTPVRGYQHEEESYDEQYGIVANDFTYGNGLGNLLASRECDFSAPALEIGCGTGMLTVGICKSNKFPLFIASDASSAFLNILKKKLDKANIFDEKTRLAVIDGDALESAPRNSFSLIVLKATLHHITDPGQFIKNISELLVPNGMLVFNEPCWEGNVLLGLMAQGLMDKRYNSSSRKFWKGFGLAQEFIAKRFGNGVGGWVSRPTNFAKLQLLIDTMKAASRRDIDKSTWEDKHLFKLADILEWGRTSNLDVEFIANRDFNEFADDAEWKTFSYRKFIFAYISKCMNYGDQFARNFEADLGTSFDYLDLVSANNNSPEYHGIFLFRKR
ncbi:MAG: glycosyltransferase [Desulfobulbaceae bacterium]|nr:glycosyltransferase [Desulfobulbaceae bacterium]